MEPAERKIGQHFMLSEEVYNGITKILDELAANTRAEVIVFCDTNGYPITHKGSRPGLDLSAISSLAANNFSATAEIASMIGEAASFKFLFHEGETMNIYLSQVGFNYILVVIFNVKVALGMIRIFTNKAIEALNRLLLSAKQKDEESAKFMDLEFKTLFNKELDRSLKL